MQKLKLSSIDWEHIVMVGTAMKVADGLSLAEIVHVETMMDEVMTKINDYLVARKKITDKRDKLIQEGQAKFDKLQKEHPNEPNHPELQKFMNGSMVVMDREVIQPLIKLEKKVVDIEIEDKIADAFRSAFQKGAFFGEGGFPDSAYGKASFARAVRAFGVDVDKMKGIGPERKATPEEEAKIASMVEDIQKQQVVPGATTPPSPVTTTPASPETTAKAPEDTETPKATKGEQDIG